MHSAEPTLARRVTLTLVATSSAAAVLALGALLLLADVFIRRHVEQGASAAAAVLVAELDEEPALAPDIAAEAAELGIDGRVAILRDDAPWAGDPRLRRPASGPCGVVEDAIARELVCLRVSSAAPELTVLVAVPAERAFGHRVPLALAAGAVLVVVLALAAWFGVVRSRRLLAPLSRLRGAVEAIDLAGQVHALPPRVGLDEIDGLRDTLAALLERLGLELSRARRFSADAAHELRTPLTKLQAELELAAEQVEGEPAIADAVTRLRRTCGHLIALTERLLLLATPGEALASTEGCSLAALAHALVERRTAVERARIVVEVDDGDALVRGDAVLLASMLDNAVDNALKFSQGSVAVAVACERAEVVVTVDDQGSGVPAAERALLFEPFRRGAMARSQPGHGLGLALVAHLARAYGGAASFVDPPVRGTRLVIRLPRHDAEQAPLQQPASPRAARP